jgi:hypothetical protein
MQGHKVDRRMVWRLVEFIFNILYAMAYTSAILWIIAIIIVIRHNRKDKK